MLHFFVRPQKRPRAAAHRDIRSTEGQTPHFSIAAFPGTFILGLGHHPNKHSSNACFRSYKALIKPATTFADLCRTGPRVLRRFNQGEEIKESWRFTHVAPLTSLLIALVPRSALKHFACTPERGGSSTAANLISVEESACQSKAAGRV